MDIFPLDLLFFGGVSVTFLHGVFFVAVLKGLLVVSGAECVTFWISFVHILSLL